MQNFQFYLTKCDVMELRFIHKDQGVKLNFFSDSHLAPKLFKVVANSKKVGCHFQRQTNPFLCCHHSRN